VSIETIILDDTLEPSQNLKDESREIKWSID